MPRTVYAVRGIFFALPPLRRPQLCPDTRPGLPLPHPAEPP